jgi:uncharacterized sulfatase
MQLVAQTSSKPNIVVIVADDLGTNELGCYGGVNVQTPHIDKLASEGVRMINNYASASISRILDTGLDAQVKTTL